MRHNLHTMCTSTVATLRAVYYYPQWGSGSIQGKAYNKEGSVVYTSPCLETDVYEMQPFWGTKLSETLTAAWDLPSDEASGIETLEAVHRWGSCRL